MMHSNYKKKIRSRNLGNLHVIPTGTHIVNKPSGISIEPTSNTTIKSTNSKPVDMKPFIEKPVKLEDDKVINNSNNQQSKLVNDQTNEPNVSKPHGFSIGKLKKKKQTNYFNFNKYKGKYNMPKNRRGQNAKGLAAMQVMKHKNSNDQWFNPDDANQVSSKSTNDSPVEESCPSVEESYFEEVEVASYEYEGQQEIPVGFRRSKVQYLKYKKNCFFKPKIFKLGTQRTIVNCLNLQDTQPNTDVDVTSEAENETESNEKYVKKNLEQKLKVESKSIMVNAPSVEDKLEPGSRAFRISIDHNNFGVKQGRSLIQKSLDSCKSHLIGLEYLLEIQNESSSSIINYHCVLCNEDLAFETSPDICVINHINSYKHIVKHLEKHFPACGYRFSENGKSSDDITVLQKICEEINHKLGYYYMCTVDINNYKKNKEKIINAIKSSKHLSEKDENFDKSIFQKHKKGVLSEEINNVISDVIDKVTPKKVNATNSKMEVNAVLAKSKPKNLCGVENNLTNDDKNNKILNDGSVKKDEKKNDIKKVTKYNSESFMASYLKLKYHKPKFTIEKVSENKDKKEVLNAKPQEQISTESPETVECIIISSDESEGGEIAPNSHKGEINSKESPEKALQKSAIHSKHCRKRILGKENSSMSAKTSAKETVTDLLNKANSTVNKSKEQVTDSTKAAAKYPNMIKLKGLGTPKKFNSVKNKNDVLKNESKCAVITTPNKAKSPLRKVVPIPKSDATSSKLSTQQLENASKIKVIHIRKESDYSSQKPGNIYPSPVVFPSRDSQHISRSPDRRLSRSPIRHSPPNRALMRLSISPVRRITSPLRLIKSPTRRNLRSPNRKHLRSSVSPFKFLSKGATRRSRSPHGIHARSPFGRHFKSPIRVHSRSPVRKHFRHSKSPMRRSSRSPVRRHSRSPIRRLSRSPLRRHSRSPLSRLSRSPVRRHSRSPVRRYSRSPLRRYSRSPVRRHSRSPARRHSRSPARRYSRSPSRRYSRSPLRRYSRSPARKYSRSPMRNHSRSPVRRHSKSPFKRHSRSPRKRHSRSPIQTRIRGSKGSYRAYSPSLKQSDEKHVTDRRNLAHSYEKHIGAFDSEGRAVSKRLSPSRNFSDKYNPSRSFASPHERDMGDLDPVSDEDESVYFNTLDKRPHLEDIKMSNITKTVLSQLLHKFTKSNVNQHDPTLRKLMHFMESSEAQSIMGSQFDSKFGSMNPLKVDAGIKERSMFLQQYLLSNLAGNVSGMQPPTPVNFLQPTFPHPSFQEVGVQQAYLPSPNVVAPLCPPQPVHNQQFYPPNLNVPPPAQISQFNHPPQELLPKPRVAPEAVFKDLKATVNKLFGGNLSEEKDKSNVPAFANEPDPIKWNLSPNTSKFGGSIGQKNMLASQGKHADFGSSESSAVEIPGLSFVNSGQFFSKKDRPHSSNMPVPPPDAKVSFCDVSRGSVKGNLFPVVHSPAKQSFNPSGSHGSVSDVKLSLAQRLASVLVKVGMIDVPAPLLQEMLMKIGAFSSSPPQDIREAEIISILKRLGYLS